MSLVNSSFAVNVTPGAMPPTVHVSEYDIGRTYTVTINGQNGSAFNIPAGTTATVEGTLNGVTGFTTDATISGSTVSFALTESMTARSGKAWCKIKLTLNNEPIQTCAFILAVDRAGVEAGTVVGAPGFGEQIQDAVDNYLEEHPVPTVTVDPTLTISGAAADAKVTGDEIGDLKSALTTIENPFFFNNISADRGVDVTIDEDGYINISGTASSSGRVTTSAVLPLTVGKWYLNIAKISGTAKPTMYVTDPGGTNVATYLAASGSTILSFDVSEAGNYGVFFWVNSSDTYSYTYSVMMTKDAPETFIKGGPIPNLYDTVEAIEKVSVKDSGNILKPAVLGAWNGLQIDYLENYQAFSITGTKGNVWSRAVIGTITPETSGSYTLSYVDRKGNGKPAIYIYNGSTQTLTWPAAYLTGTATLTAGVTYTVEAYLAPNETADYLVSLKCESGTEATLFKPYGMVRKFDLSGKTFSICGVSIDTYYGWIPDGNLAYYSSNNLPSVNMTWWKKLMDDTGIQLVINNSWSASCASTANKPASSGAHRCLALNDGTKIPDIIIIGMFGANDWAASDMGEYTFGMNLPGVDDDLTDSTTYDTYKAVTDTYAGGLATMFYRIHAKYPHARIYALDMYNYYRGAGLDPSGTSANHNIPFANKTLYDVAEAFGVTVIHTSECGINAVNSGDYCVDASGGTPLHPNDAGHTLIYQTVKNRLKYDFGM